ncbi:MAG: carboxypeptidase regulatory-like domain-containing protein [Acidobacteriales bacterium]|nr:carboxypeptidase regulatory-like domain-containing protein [Terriglobales bacterium]
MTLALGSGLTVWAQSTTEGAIAGAVYDQQGASIPTAKVTIVNAGTNRQTSVEVDGSGGFRVAHLQPGTYQVTIEATGFAKFIQNDVIVEVGRITTLEPRLSVAGSSETVTVTGEAPAVNVEQADFSTNLNQLSITELPINGRRWSNFALLTPGANPDGGFGLISFRGVSGLLNNNTIDGGDNNQAFFSEERGRTRIGYAVSQDAVREFQVNTSNYSAEYGRAAGGVVNAVTKTGTNTFHGSAFYYNRDNNYGATNPFTRITTVQNGVSVVTAVKPKDKRHQMGGSLGGAIVRDKLFFFFSYDQQKRNFPGLAVADSPAAFFATPAAALPAGRTCSTLVAGDFANTNTFNATRSACTLQGRLAAGTTYAQAVTGYNQGLGFLSSLTGVVQRQGDQTIVFPKLDWVIHPRHTATVSYNRLRWNSPAGVQTQPFVSRGIASFGDDFVKVDALSSRLTSTLSDRITNELRYQYGRDFELQNSQPPAPGEPATSNGRPPQVAVNGSAFTFGKANFLERRAFPDERRSQVADTISFAHGRHFLKAGIDINHVNDVLDNLRNESGSYLYNNVVDFVSDFLRTDGGCTTGSGATLRRVGCYSGTYQQAFGPTRFEFNTVDFAYFIQDDWKILPRLTLNIGVRYEFEQLPDPQIPNPALLQTSRFPRDKNNIGPRFGFAYDPFGDGKTAIRGGYGLYYGRIINSTIANAITNTGLPTGQTTFALRATDAGAPLYPNVLAAPPSVTGVVRPNIVFFDSKFQNPIIQQADLVVEREIGWNTVISGSYLLSLGHHLPNFIDTNIAPSGRTISYLARGGPLDGQVVTLPLYTALPTAQSPNGRPDSRFTGKTAIISNINSSYNAMVLQVNKRFSNGLQFQNSYSFSHAIDFNQGSVTFTNFNDAFDPFNPDVDKGNSRFDIRHRIVSSVVWQPTWRFDNKALDQIVNGFTLSPIVSFATGIPYSPTVTGNAPGGLSSGINGTGHFPSRVLTQGRNNFRQPETVTVDMRLSRRFSVSERLRLEALVEAFNLFNHQNVTGVGTREYTIGGTAAAPVLNFDSTFGTVTGTNGNTIFRERQVQLALRLQF